MKKIGLKEEEISQVEENRKVHSEQLFYFKTSFFNLEYLKNIEIPKYRGRFYLSATIFNRI